MLFLSKWVKFSFGFCLPIAVLLAAENTGVSEVQKLANAERSFAQTSLARGIREAFVTYLADDGIIFRPGPINGKESWSARPDVKASLLWGPIYAEISRSNDFGYTTGPSQFKPDDPKARVYHGNFVSIWKKQSDGQWKVRLDVGIENPEPADEGERLRTREQPPEAVPNTTEPQHLFEIERKFVEQAKRDAATAFDQFASDDVRVFRDGAFPAVGKTVARDLLVKNPGSVHTREQRGEVSRAGDLGYTFGEYAGGTDHLNYLRIWRKEREWRLVVDLSKPFPKPNE
jgi:ketosteroid isomerase-like protein